MVEEDRKEYEENYSPVEKTVHSLSGLIIKKYLDKGQTLEIPSLNIEIIPRGLENLTQ